MKVKLPFTKVPNRVDSINVYKAKAEEENLLVTLYGFDDEEVNKYSSLLEEVAGYLVEWRDFVIGPKIPLQFSIIYHTRPTEYEFKMSTETSYQYEFYIMEELLEFAKKLVKSKNTHPQELEKARKHIKRKIKSLKVLEYWGKPNPWDPIYVVKLEKATPYAGFILETIKMYPSLVWHIGKNRVTIQPISDKEYLSLYNLLGPIITGDKIKSLADMYNGGINQYEKYFRFDKEKILNAPENLIFAKYDRHNVLAERFLEGDTVILLVYPPKDDIYIRELLIIIPTDVKPVYNMLNIIWNWASIVEIKSPYDEINGLYVLIHKHKRKDADIYRIKKGWELVKENDVGKIISRIVFTARFLKKYLKDPEYSSYSEVDITRNKKWREVYNIIMDKIIKGFINKEAFNNSLRKLGLDIDFEDLIFRIKKDILYNGKFEQVNEIAFLSRDISYDFYSFTEIAPYMCVWNDNKSAAYSVFVIKPKGSMQFDIKVFFTSLEFNAIRYKSFFRQP